MKTLVSIKEKVEIAKIVGFVLKDQLLINLKLIIMASKKRLFNCNIIG
jgi:hypothetical protein